MKKRIAVVVAAAAMTLPFSGTANAQQQFTSAVVTIVPIVANATEVATVQMAALPTGGFTATGTGSGFTTSFTYASLAYGLGSVPVPQPNIPACADDGTLGDPTVSTVRMFVGIWTPPLTDNRTLVGVNALTNIDLLNTMSIRRANVAVVPGPGDVRPQIFQIRSCGQLIKA